MPIYPSRTYLHIDGNGLDPKIEHLGGGIQEDHGRGVRRKLEAGLGKAGGMDAQSPTDIQVANACPAKRKYQKKSSPKEVLKAEATGEPTPSTAVVYDDNDCYISIA